MVLVRFIYLHDLHGENDWSYIYMQCLMYIRGRRLTGSRSFQDHHQRRPPISCPPASR